MKRKIFMLAMAMAFGSVMLAGCDRQEPKAANAEADKRVDSPRPAPGSSSAPVALGQPSTEAEKKAGQPPVQGEVDAREPAQRSEFEQKK
jgi:hypothetical protein